MYFWCICGEEGDLHVLLLRHLEGLSLIKSFKMQKNIKQTKKKLKSHLKWRMPGIKDPESPQLIKYFKVVEGEETFKMAEE